MVYDSIEAQERNLDAIIRNGGLEFPEPFAPYTSGTIGPLFIQSIVVEANGSDYRFAIDSLKSLIKNEIEYDFDVISGGDSRDWDFSNPVAVALRIAHAKLYKNKKSLGADMCDKNVVHVADLNNQGSSVQNMWIPYIRKVGGKINDVVFFVDRMEVEGQKAIKEVGLKSHSVVKLDALAWDYLRETGKITETIYNSLMDYYNDKNAWAEDMLTSDAGLRKMNELLKSPDTTIQIKGHNILNHYETIKDEILSGIKALNAL